MVEMLLMRLEQLTVMKGSAMMSQRSCCTLLVALVKLKAPISNELHRYVLENMSLYMEVTCYSDLALSSLGCCKPQSHTLADSLDVFSLFRICLYLSCA
jgi:hypothetical protein